jgi:hypothetical protein
MSEMKALSHTIQKLQPMLKILKSRLDFKVKVSRSKIWYQEKGTHMYNMKAISLIM